MFLRVILGVEHETDIHFIVTHYFDFRQPIGETLHFSKFFKDIILPKMVEFNSFCFSINFQIF